METDGDYGTDHFDLLPFIAVLLCVMGCLLLVTISTSAVSVVATIASSGDQAEFDGYPLLSQSSWIRALREMTEVGPGKSDVPAGRSIGG